jgi:hypothetical protein
VVLIQPRRIEETSLILVGDRIQIDVDLEDLHALRSVVEHTEMTRQLPIFTTSLVCEVVRTGAARPTTPTRISSAPSQTIGFMRRDYSDGAAGIKLCVSAKIVRY